MCTGDVISFVSELQQKEFRDLSDRCLATLEHMYHILCRLNEIKCGMREKIRLLESSLHSTFEQAVEVEVESRLRQMKELTTVRAVAETQVCHKMVNFRLICMGKHSSVDVGSCCT